MYNLKFKGIYKNEQQLLDGKLLPESAQRINAPSGIVEENLFGVLFIPFIISINLIIFFSKEFYIECDIITLNICSILSLIVSFIFSLMCIFISMYILYNKKLEKEVWIHVKSLTIFIHCIGLALRKRYVLGKKDYRDIVIIDNYIETIERKFSPHRSISNYYKLLSIESSIFIYSIIVISIVEIYKCLFI